MTNNELLFIEWTANPSTLPSSSSSCVSGLLDSKIFCIIIRVTSLLVLIRAWEMLMTKRTIDLLDLEHRQHTLNTFLKTA